MYQEGVRAKYATQATRLATLDAMPRRPWIQHFDDNGGSEPALHHQRRASYSGHWNPNSVFELDV